MKHTQKEKKMSKKLSILLLSSLLILGHSCQANPTPMPPASKAPQDHLDLVILIDKSPGKLGMPEEAQAAQTGDRIRSMTMTLADAIQSGVPILASGHLLNNVILYARDPNSTEVIQDRTHFREVFKTRSWGNIDESSIRYVSTYISPLIDKIKNFYHIYLPKNVAKDSNFVLLLPKTMNPGEVGFNPNNIELTSYNDLENIFKKRYKPPFNENLITEPNIIKNLEALFSSTNVLPKRIYLSGHGSHGQIIANLNKKEYQDLLKLFNTIHCQFLLVNSCYAGGKNLVDMHKLNTEEQKILFSGIKEEPQFIISIESITDQPTTAAPLGQAHFDKFFDTLNRYFTAWGKEKPKLKEVFKFFVSDANLFNMPSIRYPGIQDFFRPAYVDDNVDIITLVSQRAHILEQKLKGKEIMPITFGEKKCLLIYPPIVEVPITITLLATNDPICFVSMISGRAIHIIKKLTAPNMNLLEVVAGLIGITGKSPKAYFIQELECLNYTGSNISENNKSELLKIKNFALMAEQVSEKNLNLTTVFQRSTTSWGDIAYKLTPSSLESPVELGTYVSQVHDIAGLLKQKAVILRIGEDSFRQVTDAIFRLTLPKAEAVRQSLGIVNAKEVLEQIEKYKPKRTGTEKSLFQEGLPFIEAVHQKKHFKEAIEFAQLTIKDTDPMIRENALELFEELVNQGQALEEAKKAASELINDISKNVQEAANDLLQELKKVKPAK